jgi:hypothetical protein
MIMSPTGFSTRFAAVCTRRLGFALAVAACWVSSAGTASAQLDPLLFIKRSAPNVLLAVETTSRMQRDTNNDYYDANIYPRTGALWEPTLGVTPLNTLAQYRRKYVGLIHTDPAAGGDKFGATRIDIVGDRQPGFGTFEEATRLAIARRGLIEAVTRNRGVARFGLLRTRQSNPAVGPEGNEGPVKVDDPTQQDPTDLAAGKWKITRTVVGAVNGSIAGPVAPLVQPDAVNANTTILNTLNLDVRQAGALIPAGRDGAFSVDAPLDNMLDDAKAEAQRLIAADAACRNTILVLVVAGAEGDTTGEDPAAKALSFVNLSAVRNVPIHVIAIAPDPAHVAQLRGIADNSGGVYTEITAAMISATTPGQPVPEFVAAVNLAVQEAFQDPTHFDVDPTVLSIRGPETEHQATSPIIGTVNLEGALDINGQPLPNDIITNPKTLAKIPQRSNVMVTSGFALPGFGGRIRAFRVYKPIADASKPSGYKFSADGTKLWVARAPDAAVRNIYTSLPDGTMVSFTAASAAVLAPYLRTTNPAALIDRIRQEPLGAIVGSTPAIMDPPSLDPPPDSDYPGFADENKGRRSIVWVGGNDGMLHAIDARLGVEVWAFIPFNLLPKLKALPFGQPVGAFRYFVDSSPKVADVKIDGNWRTYLTIGQGSGGTFYQTLDVTLDDMALVVTADDNDINKVLGYFADPARVPLKWAFPQYSEFDHTLFPWGDIAAAAPAVSKTVGQTWSDPAIGQIGGPSGKHTLLTGSGFLPYTTQQAANRGGVIAGTTFYLLDMKTGALLDSRDVGNDGVAETVDDCAAAGNCTRLKNALQADPVATGPPNSRFVDRAYMGDLDGRLWRFDIVLDATKTPRITALTNLLPVAAVSPAHPFFASMATVNVGGTKNYLFQGTGSDLLPSAGAIPQYKLMIVSEAGASGTLEKEILLTTTAALHEKVTAFPAVAGDIVFFSTTTYKPTAPCSNPDGALYAFTFVGGAAYDTNNSGNVTAADTPKIKTTVGARASAPFITDQHLVFGAGDKIEMFGDPDDFNNGVGQVGVRILSWRDVR